jgi:hypothetical protein
VNFEGFLFSYFEISKSSTFPLVILKVSHEGNNVRGIVLKFGGFQICFGGIQGSSTLLLRILGVSSKKLSEFELFVPFCLHHLKLLFSQNKS